METSLPTPMTGRVYVNLPEGSVFVVCMPLTSWLHDGDPTLKSWIWQRNPPKQTGSFPGAKQITSTAVTWLSQTLMVPLRCLCICQISICSLWHVIYIYIYILLYLCIYIIYNIVSIWYTRFQSCCPHGIYPFLFVEQAQLSFNI